MTVYHLSRLQKSASVTSMCCLCCREMGVFLSLSKPNKGPFSSAGSPDGAVVVHGPLCSQLNCVTERTALTSFRDIDKKQLSLRIAAFQRAGHATKSCQHAMTVPFSSPLHPPTIPRASTCGRKETVLIEEHQMQARKMNPVLAQEIIFSGTHNGGDTHTLSPCQLSIGLSSEGTLEKKGDGKSGSYMARGRERE